MRMQKIRQTTKKRKIKKNLKNDGDKPRQGVRSEKLGEQQARQPPPSQERHALHSTPPYQTSTTRQGEASRSSPIRSAKGSGAELGGPRPTRPAAEQGFLVTVPCAAASALSLPLRPEEALLPLVTAGTWPSSGAFPAPGGTALPLLWGQGRGLGTQYIHVARQGAGAFGITSGHPQNGSGGGSPSAGRSLSPT